MKTKCAKAKRLLGILICLCMALILVPAVSLPVSALDNLTVTIDTGESVTLKDADGDGYYDIGTADELYAFAAAINGNNLAINGELTANIVVNQNVLVDGALNSNTEGFRVWKPMGGNIYRYNGTFDGGDHTVSGLYFNNIDTRYVGLFGYVSHGIVKNVGVVDSYFSGFQYVGGVVGKNDGTVTDCYNTGPVMGCKNNGGFNTSDYIGGVVGYNNGGTVTGCYNTGNISGIDDIGGVVGFNSDGTVTGCYNTGNVSGRISVGGVVGDNSGAITGCYNIGNAGGVDRVGGAAGYNTGTVQRCYSMGNVSGSTSVGGVAGRNNGGTVALCYYDNTVYSGDAIDIIINGGTATDVLGKTTEQFASGEVAYLLQGEQTEQVWGQSIGTDAYPVLGGAQVYYGYISSKFGAVKVYTNDANATAENVHTGEVKYTPTEDGKQHIAKCAHCGEEIYEDHTGGTATCKEQAKCSRCGASYGELGDHTGGTATCKTQAVCEVCGASYGELDPNNHENETNNGICCDTYQSAILNADGYYEIFNAGQLYWFAQQVNIVGNTAANGKLMADIDLENRVWYPIGLYNDIAKANGSPVQKQYTGTFNGNNHTVSNFTAIGNGSQGLFGYCKETQTQIKNLGVINAAVSGWNAGAVAGYCANLTNCYAVGCTITGSSDTNTAPVTISSLGGNNGNTVIDNCWAYDCELIVGEGEADFVMHPVGGVIGSSGNVYTVRNCYYGEIVTDAEFTSTTGAAEKTKAQFASGEVAYLLGSAWGQNIGTDDYPVLGGETVYYGYADCTATEKTYTNSPPLENTGAHSFNSNGFCDICNSYEPAVDSNADGYYEIGNAGQLFWFAQQINKVDRTLSAVLTADIDLENRPWIPIGSTGEGSNNFRGVFDGQNHTIKGLYVEGGRAGLGFFGEVRTGTVKNFTIYGEVVVNTEVDYVGGVIGSACGLNGDNSLARNGAIIQNITSYVNLTAKAHGVGMIGGFVGYANHESLIENCAWYGTFDAGIYRVDNGAGGFIGRIRENTSNVTIRNCAAYGTIKTKYAKNSFNNTATIYIGGFLSFSNTGAQSVLENCLFAGKFERGENLTDEARLGAFGTLRGVKSIKNCYYLGDDGLAAVHSDSPLKPESENVEITSVTGEQLKSGEVAYLLQSNQTEQIWGQTCGTGLPAFGGPKVYVNPVNGCCDKNYVYEYANTALTDYVPQHDWKNVTCTTPKTCTACGVTEGEALGGEHIWLDATCAAPRTCSRCGETEGGTLAHTLTGSTDGCCVYGCGTLLARAMVTINGATTCYENLFEAVNAGNTAAPEDDARVTLLKDIEDINAGVTGTFTLDLNGCTVGTVGSSATVISLSGSGAVTVVDSRGTAMVHGIIEGNGATMLLGGNYQNVSFGSGVTLAVDPATGVGPTFIGGIEAKYGVNSLLAEGCSYFAGDTRVEVADDVTYIEGTVTVRPSDWKPASGTVTPKSATLSLEDEVLINLYFLVEEMEVTPENVGLLIYNENPETADISTADTVVEGGLYNASNGRYMVSTPGIPGQYLADSLYLVAYAKDANGNYVYARTVEYSGKKYCTSQMTKGTEELKATCVALMNYGAAAQQYFAATTDYTYETLMNEDFAQYQDLVVDYSEDLLAARQSVDAAKAGSLDTEKNGFAKRSVSMSADGDFSLNYYFTTDKAADKVTFYYWTADQYNSVDTLTTANASGSKEMVLTDGANRYWANFAGIAAKDIDKTIFACGVYEVDGVTYSTGVFSYSIGYYCTGKAAGTDEVVKPFAKAIAVYSYHARIFLESLN